MNFEERSYSSSLMRPRPIIYNDPSGNFLLIVTAWGASNGTERIIDNVKQHLQSVKQDEELTTPFQNILTLSDEANDLRVTTLMTNDLVFRSLNQDRYNVVIETCFVNLKNNHVAWCQMGGPHLFLKKKNSSPQPISCFPESRSELQGVPLPTYFLGAEPTISPRCGDLYLEPGDELILLSSSTIPSEVWHLRGDSSLQDWTNALAEKDYEQPFWLGRIQL
jgi:hypothetical protein